MNKVIVAIAVLVAACMSSAVGAQQLQYVSGSGQAATVGMPFAFPWVVKVVDANGDPMAGQEITFASGMATFGDSDHATVVTGTDGMAASPIAMAGPTLGHGVASACDATAICAFFTFQIVTTPAPGAVFWLNPPPQSVEKDKAALRPWVLQILDPYGSPLAGVPVTFEADGSCGSFSGAQRVDVVSGADGLAPSPPYVGKTAGEFCISSVTVAGTETEPFDTFGMFVFDPRNVTIVAPTFINATAGSEFVIDLTFTAPGNDGADWLIYGLPVQIRVVDAHGGASAQVISITEDEFDYNAAHVKLAANRKAGFYFVGVTRGPVTTWILVQQRK